ncbi:hypothetical protein [Cytobacillus pseudoceanisediminis]|uniref:hypothetical protein n=1 Tax=Cytobacillus pseudoceanisediminis TaxID=3051614 RepID=UPI003CFBACDB
MFGYTWGQTVPYISLIIALLALFINFSKFFIELYDRKEKRRKEDEEKKEKKKAKLTVNAVGGDIIIQNSSTVDAYIKEIYVDGKEWYDANLFSADRPSLISAGQTKTFMVHTSKDNHFPFGMSIEYADNYSREYMTETWKQEFEL